jgi:hypothetical protein
VGVTAGCELDDAEAAGVIAIIPSAATAIAVPMGRIGRRFMGSPSGWVTALAAMAEPGPHRRRFPGV